VKKQVQTFLLPEDEKALSHALRAIRPSIQFVDDSVWPSQTPPAHDSIAGCSSPWAFIWDTAIFPELPSRERPDGRFDGPSSGVVFQVVRSRKEESILLSGRLAIGWDDTRAEFQDLVRTVFSTLKDMTRDAVWVSSGQKAREYRVGSAASLWRQTEGNVFCDRATRYVLE
jgi:hypothetical protein